MAKIGHPPAFLFYPDDFSSDGKVEAMSTEQVGAYILLLCKSWREKPPGSLPSDDSLLAKWARVSLDRWSAIRSGVLAPYTFGTDSRWHQKRQRAEYDKLMSLRRSRSMAAKSRWDNSLHARALHMQCIPSPSPSPIKEKPKTIAQNPGERELTGFENFWNAYPKHVGKPAARRAWLSKVRDDSKWPEVIVSLEAWKQSEQWQDRQFVPYPATFLNQERWRDEVPKGGGLADQNSETAKRIAAKYGLKWPN